MRITDNWQNQILIVPASRGSCFDADFVDNKRLAVAIYDKKVAIRFLSVFKVYDAAKVYSGCLSV